VLGDFKPNLEQEQGINAHEGPFVCIAGPGSGKSTTLTRRHMALLMKGIPEKDILNLTFTSSAAENMVEKIGLLNADKIFRTFHSWAMDLLKRESQYLPFQVCDTIIPVYGQDFLLLKELLKTYPAISSFRSLKDKLSEWKRSNIDPAQAQELVYHNGTEFWYAAAYADYEKKSREQGWLDFDSLMKETVKLLETNDEVRKRNIKKYISVDECQDTDVVQFQLLRLIYGGNIFVVGDENQLIYEWRSAQAGNLSNFARVFPGARTLYLGQNYRSTKKLVEFFKKILPVDNGLASHMFSNREDGTDPIFTKFEDDVQEASIVLSRVTDPNNTAVIARTNRQLMTFQKMCMARGLKSQVLGKKNLWQQTEVAHLLKLAKEKDYGTKPAHEVFNELIRQHNLTFLYRNSGNPMEKDPTENLNDIVKLSAKRGSVSEFLTWLRKLTYASRSKNKPEPVLTLSTVHQAKGREFQNVFVIGAKQGTMPHKDGELLEEARIFFVACSRAADRLEISYHGPRSQFLNDFEKEIVIYGERKETAQTNVS
jgi:DNA helicase-2/ATP-dependent DNA helicase PcrA